MLPEIFGFCLCGEYCDFDHHCPYRPDFPRIYRKAADLLRVRGWGRGAYEDGNGFLCLVGAVNVAGGLEARCGSAAPDEASDRLTSPLSARLHMPVAEWNDTYCESREAAVNLLLETAASYPRKELVKA